MTEAKPVYAHPVNDDPHYVYETAISHDAFPLPCVNEVGAREYLNSNGWTPGLVELFMKSSNAIPIRFVIVDDSGSMSTTDGRRLIVQGQRKLWSELTESLRFHATLADAARAPTEFRLLNGAPPVMVGCGDSGEGLRQVLSLFDQSPGGGTPLCAQVQAVVEQIRDLAPQLRANGQRAALIIATDGEASDGDIAYAMKPLQYLPVWVVIRLCTGEERICDYWNNIDRQLELDMDVLDDIETEALEISKVNDWFTYSEPLHRLREFGITMKDMDLIDECTLAADQMRNVVATMTTGGPPSEIPHPDVDWKEFLQFIRTISDDLPKTWCPLDKTMKPWIRLHQLVRTYGRGKGDCLLM